MGRVVFTILIFCSLAVSAQQTMNFRQVDTTTYQQYLRGDWSELLKTGKEGLDQGISYYYLQMRIAYAHYMREEYRAAIKYYKNALEFNSKDPVANEFLYNCYLYSGRSNDALLQTKALSASQKNEIGIPDSSTVISVGVSYSYASSDATSIHEDIVNDLNGVQNGVQKTSNYFHLPSFALSHNVGQHVILNHTISLLKKNEFSYAYNSAFFLSPEQLISQLEYGFSMEITPSEGWLIRPGFNYLNLTVPLFELTAYGPGAGRDRTAYDYVTIKNRAFSLLVSKEFRFFNLGLSYANNNFNTIQTHQAGLHSSIYPLSNMNLYYSFDLYYQGLLFNGESQSNYIFLRWLIMIKHP